MKQQHLIQISGAAVVLLIIGTIIVAYGVAQGGNVPGMGRLPTEPPPPPPTFTLPTVQITPPPSLEEIAAEVEADYPELADLLKNPELGSVYKDFYLAYQNGGREAAIALARQRTILNAKDEIVMTLVLDTAAAETLISQLQAEGVIINGMYENLINVAIPLSLVDEQIRAESPELIVERISDLEHVIRLEFPHKATNQQAGMVQGQGVQQTNAARWHEQGISGHGVRIGMLDLGFANYQGLLGHELPNTVNFASFGDTSELGDEMHGTACAEIVHEMAPGATLVLAQYDGTDAAMGQAVNWLIQQNVDIISNSTNGIGTTPLNGTGFSAELVNKAHAAGILWVNSAGNYAERHYRGAYRDLNGDNLHDFASADDPYLPFMAEPDVATRIVLSWNDWEDVDQDYELILYEEDGTVLAKSEEPQTGSRGQRPLEGFVYVFERADVYLLAIENYNGSATGDVIFNLFIEPSVVYPDLAVAEHSLGSPSDAVNAFAVGATHWAYDSLEDYSSNGPTSDGRIKPDISAPAAVDTNIYYPDSFQGTSAAAPHVSGAAALVWQAYPNFNTDEVRNFLQSRAVDLGVSGKDNQFGVGRLDLGVPPNLVPANEPPPTPVAQILPTSTPRPMQDTTPEFGSRGDTRPGSETSDLVAALIFLGFCLICIAGVVLLGVLVAAVAIVSSVGLPIILLGGFVLLAVMVILGLGFFLIF